MEAALRFANGDVVMHKLAREDMRGSAPKDVIYWVREADLRGRGGAEIMLWLDAYQWDRWRRVVYRER